MKNTHYILGLIIICLFAFSCEKERVEEGYLGSSSVQEVEGLIKETTFPILAEDEFFLEQDDSLTWIINKHSNLYDSLKVGSVFGGGMTDKFPIPYLKYIESIEDLGDHRILKVRQAGLMEAFTDLSINMRVSQNDIESRGLVKKIVVGPFAMNLSGGGQVDVTPDFSYAYDTIIFTYEATKSSVESFSFGVKGLKYDQSIETSVSGTLEGSTSITLDPNLKLPVTIPAGPIPFPIIISNRIVIKPTASLDGNGGYVDIFSRKTDPFDFVITVDRSGVTYETNINELDLTDDFSYQIPEAFGSLEATIGIALEYQMSLYEAYSIGNLFLNVNPFQLGLDLSVSPSEPVINVNGDYLFTVNAGLRGASGFANLFLGDSDYEIFNLIEFNQQLFELRENLVAIEVPMSCQLDIGESTLNPRCNTQEGKIELDIRWNANEDVEGQFVLKVGDLIADFYDFNKDYTVNVNSDWFGPNREIVFEHEDYTGCQHRYSIANPCFTFENCPNGNCWKKMKDGKTWMTVNIKDTGAGTCLFNNSSNCETLGEYFTREQLLNGESEGGTIKGLCPNGWHVPTYSEWRNLILAYVSDDATHNNGVGPLIHPDIPGYTEYDPLKASGFNMIPTGAYHPWQEGDIAFEGSYLDDDEPFFMFWVSDFEESFATPFVMSIDKGNTEIVKVRVTDNLALPCRCVQD